MDNHNQMCASVFIILASAVLYSGAESQQIDQYNVNNVIAWTGEDVNLHCRTNRSESVNRYWKRGEEILTMANNVWTSNRRIEPLNNSITLRINNVSVDDQGEYTCVVNSKPIHQLTLNLQVKDFTCDPPEKPLNGDYKEDSNNSYTFNNQIHYFCNRGFELVGSASRTCSGPPHGWTPHEPFCEPDYIVRLQKSVAIIGNKMSAMEIKVTTMESKMTEMEIKMTTMESKITVTESECTTLGNRMTTLERDMTTMGSNRITPVDTTRRTTQLESGVMATERSLGSGQWAPDSVIARLKEIVGFDDDELFD